jgi:hypothetical protein
MYKQCSSPVNFRGTTRALSADCGWSGGPTIGFGLLWWRYVKVPDKTDDHMCILLWTFVCGYIYIYIFPAILRPAPKQAKEQPPKSYPDIQVSENNHYSVPFQPLSIYIYIIYLFIYLSINLFIYLFMIITISNSTNHCAYISPNLVTRRWLCTNSPGSYVIIAGFTLSFVKASLERLIPTLLTLGIDVT